MSSRIRLYCARLILVAITGALCLPTMVRAQSRVSVSISPLVGAGNFMGRAEMIPTSISTDRSIHLDAVTYVGLQLELNRERYPLDLRLGGARTVGGYLRAQQGSVQTWNRTAVKYGSVGEAAVTFLWTDVRFDPLAWKLRPYLYVGASFRWTSMSAQSREIVGLDGSTARFQGRWGYGLELDALGDRALWVEIAKPLGRAERRPFDPSEPGWQPGDLGPSVTLGMKLFTF